MVGKVGSVKAILHSPDHRNTDMSQSIFNELRLTHIKVRALDASVFCAAHCLSFEAHYAKLR